MKLLFIALALFALGHGASAVNGADTPPPGQQGTSQYVTPSCHGDARVPGYQQCHH